MLRKLTLLVFSALLALAMPMAAQAKTFYWISHGSPADPVWTYFLAGAEQWAKDTGNTVNTSFHNGDVPSQQEAVRAAIAAKADGIVTTSPDPGSLVEVAKEANAAKHPDHQLQHARPDRQLRRLCRRRQRHLRQALGAVPGRQGPGEEGRLRLDAGRGPRRHLRRAGGGRHQERVRAARHHLRGHRGHARPGRGHHPHVRLPDRQPRQDQGDHRPRRPGHRLDQARVRPGRRQAGRNPGGRLGQLARHHPGSAERLRQRRAVAGPAGDQLRRRCRWPTWRRAASRRASTSSPARSTRRTRRRSTTTSCRASKSATSSAGGAAARLLPLLASRVCRRGACSLQSPSRGLTWKIAPCSSA